MRTGVLIVALVFLAYHSHGDRTRRAAAADYSLRADLHSSSTSSASLAAPSRVDFDSQIKPILQSKCVPCHFNGGKMYEHLPFDRPETIKKLGDKLFTRIKDEEHRRLIREFLAQQP
jgi:hypothetical protein